PILRFFSAIWKIIRTIVQICVSIFVIGVIVIVCIGLFAPSGPRVPKKAALVWAPQGTVVEANPGGPSHAIRRVLGEGRAQSSLLKLKVALKRAASDPHIKMAVLKLGHMGNAGVAQLQGLREAIRDFKASGKPVI